MSTVLDEPVSRQSTSPADRLRTTMAAVRVSFTWLGVRKTLTPEQKAEAAEPFGANAHFLSAGKKLIDTSHPAFKAVTTIRNRAKQFWASMSLPYPEAGVRLIRQDRVDNFDAKMQEFKEELAEAVSALDRQYAELKATAQRRLGSLFNRSDYPASLQGMFDVSWDFPSVEPPDYLRQLNPDLYEQECQRVQSRFDDAVRLAEEAFIGELAKLVSHLTERLSGQEDGKPKIFRDSADGELDRVLPAVSAAQCPQQRAARRSCGTSPAHHPGRRAAGPSRQRGLEAAGGHGHVPRAKRAGWSPRGSAAAKHSPPGEVKAHAMQLIVEPGGVVRSIYGEEIDLAVLGSPAIIRASHVEPDQDGRWQADLSPVGGPVLGPFDHRSEALAAEHAWLEINWLGNPDRHAAP